MDRDRKLRGELPSTTDLELRLKLIESEATRFHSITGAAGGEAAQNGRQCLHPRFRRVKGMGTSMTDR